MFFGQSCLNGVFNRFVLFGDFLLALVYLIVFSHFLGVLGLFF